MVILSQHTLIRQIDTNLPPFDGSAKILFLDENLLLRYD